MTQPERKVQSMEEFMERLPEVKEVIVDGSERPVRRSKNAEKQKEEYSGKKKRHTRQHISGSTRQKRVILLSKARAGNSHDKRQLEEFVEKSPDEVRIEGDLAFQGLPNEYKNIRFTEIVCLISMTD